MKLNLGSGPKAVPGWVNVDYSLASRLRWVPFSNRLFSNSWDRSIAVIDLRKRFPWPDGAADAIYSSHFLEHLSRDDGAHFLRECARTLKPGAVLRVVVPDLASVVDAYERGDLLAEDFIDVLGTGYTKTGWQAPLAPLVETPHKTMYDSAALLRAFETAGLAATLRGAFDSAIDDIREVEIEDRTRNAVIVEETR